MHLLRLINLKTSFARQSGNGYYDFLITHYFFIESC